jgi:hypothetical protein
MKPAPPVTRIGASVRAWLLDMGEVLTAVVMIG